MAFMLFGVSYKMRMISQFDREAQQQQKRMQQERARQELEDYNSQPPAEAPM